MDGSINRIKLSVLLKPSAQVLIFGNPSDVEKSWFSRHDLRLSATLGPKGRNVSAMGTYPHPHPRPMALAAEATSKQNKRRRQKTERGRIADELIPWNGRDFRSEQELGGKQRFSADGFADWKECQVLLDLALDAAVQGDGFLGDEVPNSDMERFEGVSTWLLAKMVAEGLVDEKKMALFIDICDRGRNVTERYFGEDGKLHFAFSQIACRTAIPEKSDGKQWMSHSIHADNCQLQASGTCLKEEPAYTSNDYSAIIYLNGDFEGGEFVFSEDVRGNVIQSEIHPKCGRIVGFSAGPENKHGVRGVRRGRRCALGLWFTKDPSATERIPSLVETIKGIRARSNGKSVVLT